MATNERFHAALLSREPAAIAQALLGEEFTLIREWDEGVADDEFGGMVLEVDDYPALVAFTSEECAGNFAAANLDLCGDDGTVSGFVVEGKALIDYLPTGYGLILNPETDDECHVLPPDLTEQVKRFT
jgi:hypothetical protein